MTTEQPENNVALAATITAGIIEAMAQMSPNLAVVASLTRAVALLDDNSPVLLAAAVELDKVRLLLTPALVESCLRIGQPRRPGGLDASE
jgi:hypothetical protein